MGLAGDRIGEVHGAGGVEGFSRVSAGSPARRTAVLVAAAGSGVDREAEGMSRAAGSRSQHVALLIVEIL